MSSLGSGQTRVLVSIIFFSRRGIKMYLQNHFAIFGISASRSAMMTKNCWIPNSKSFYQNSFYASSLSIQIGMYTSISLSLDSNKFSKNLPISNPPTGERSEVQHEWQMELTVVKLGSQLIVSVISSPSLIALAISLTSLTYFVKLRPKAFRSSSLT